MKAKLKQLYQNELGAFSIEMMLVIGIIVMLVIVSMSVFSRETSEMSNQYDKNISNALQQQNVLNSQILSQKKTF